MKQYLELIQRILDGGETDTYRNGNRKALYGEKLTFDLQEGFPLVTTRKIGWKAPIAGMLWFLTGSSNTKDLVTLGSPNVWAQWADEEGSIGHMYGELWRRAPNNGYATEPNLENKVAPDVKVKLINDSTTSGIPYDVLARLWTERYVDQLHILVEKLKSGKVSSRLRICSYNPMFVPEEHIDPKSNIKNGKGSLTPCIPYIHFTTSGNKLSLHVTQASSDVLIGLPFNLAEYASLVHIVANETNLEVGTLHYNIVNAHLYENQLPTLEEYKQLEREPYTRPKLVLHDNFDMWYPSIDDMSMEGLKQHGPINYKVSV